MNNHTKIAAARTNEFDAWLNTMELSGLGNDLSFINVWDSPDGKDPGKTPNFNVKTDDVAVARSWVDGVGLGGVAAAFGGNHKRCNLFVFDADTADMADKVEAILLERLMSACYATTRKGKHFYFTYDPLEVQPPSPKKGDQADIRANRVVVQGIADVTQSCIILPGTYTLDSGTRRAHHVYRWVSNGGALPHMDADLYKALWELGNFDQKRTNPTTGTVEHIYPWKNWQRKPSSVDQLITRLAKEPVASDVGGRNNYLHALAVYCRHTMKLDETGISASLYAENARFSEELPQSEVDNIIRTVSQYETGQAEEHHTTVLARELADSLSNFIRFSQGANVLPGNYEYSDGVYSRRADDNESNENLVRRYLCDNDMERLCRNSLVTEVRKQFLYILSERNPSNQVPDNHWLDGRDDDTCYIPMKSCLVDVKKYAMARATGITTDEWKHEQTPLYFTEGKRGFDVDPNAECPTFEAFISQLLPNPDTRAEFKKHVGMILLPRTKVRDQVAMHLDGPAGAGKSTILNILRALVSKSSTLPYRQMVEGTHPMLAMLNSDLNIDGDVSSTSLDITTFNKVVEGAYMSWNEKNKPIFQARVSAHCVSAGNNFFNLSRDKASAGFWRRMRVYPCFSTEYIHDLETKLAKEMPGIFNWAADGLAEYLCNGLGVSNEMSAFIDEQKEKDSLHDFISSTCTEGEDKYTTRGIIYPAYEAFCRAYGYSPLSWSSFKERCIQAGFFTTKEPVTKRIAQFAHPVKVFAGVEWIGDQSVSLDTSDLRKAMQVDQLRTGSKIVNLTL